MTLLKFCELTLTIGFSYSCLNVRDVPNSLPSQAKSNNAHISCQKLVRIGHLSLNKISHILIQWHVLAIEEFLICLFILKLFSQSAFKRAYF